MLPVTADSLAATEDHGWGYGTQFCRRLYGIVIVCVIAMTPDPCIVGGQS